MERKREKLLAGEMDAPPENDSEKEKWIQEYAKLLDNIKTSNPAEYQRIVKQLQNQAGKVQEGQKIKLPGQNKVLGEDGIEAEEVDREEVVPDPGFVIKTRDQKGGDDRDQRQNIKVFINICTSSKLKKFKQVKKKMADGSVQEGLNIPLSCGAAKHEKDKRGQPCVVFDMIVHPSVVIEAQADKTGNFRHWVCNFALQYVQQKHHVNVDYKYKLPKMKYKGDLSGGKRPTMQYIRKVGPMIEEVESESTGGNTKKSKVLKNKRKKVAKSLEFAKYSITCQYKDGRPDAPVAAGLNADSIGAATKADAIHFGILSNLKKQELPFSLTIRVQFAHLAPKEASELRIEMSHELIVISAPRYRRLELFLPLPVQKTCTTANFDGLEKGGELVLVHLVDKDRYLNMDEDGTQPDEGSRPWLLADALKGLASESGGVESKSNNSVGTDIDTMEDKEEFPEDAFHRQDVMSMHYLAEKKKQQAHMKQKQAEAEKERQEKIARAKAGDKSISLEGTDGGIISEIIGGEDEDDENDNDMPELPAGILDDDTDDENEDNFLKAATQFELLD